MHRFANPLRFLRLAAAIQPWAAGLCVVLLGLGLYFGLFASPADYQQGESVRIKLGMPSIDPSMLLPLMLMGLGFTAFFVAVLLLKVRAEILGAKIRAIRLTQIHAAPAAGLPAGLAERAG